jgi:hypothetical protein
VRGSKSGHPAWTHETVESGIIRKSSASATARIWRDACCEPRAMSKVKPNKRAKPGSSVVLLRDLAPRNEVTGGTSKVLFGERREPAKDTPKKSSEPKRKV